MHRTLARALTDLMMRRCLFTLLFIAAAACGPQDAELDESESALVRARDPIPNRYIVVLNPTGQRSIESVRDDLAVQYGATVERTYRHALSGFAGEMTRGQAIALTQDPRVALVEEDGVVHAIATQTNATWGLDRIDQAQLPLDASYTYHDNAGAGVRVYVIDTGILETHDEFSGRVLPGADFVDN